MGKNTGEVITTPWRWWLGDVCIGRDRSVWVYARLPTHPLDDEDPDTRYEIGERLRHLLADIGSLIPKPVTHSRTFSSSGRRIHLVVLTWEDRLVPPAGTPQRLARWQRENFDDGGWHRLPQRAVFLGVESKSHGAMGLSKAVLAGFRELLSGEEADLAAYQQDLTILHGTIARWGGVPLSNDDRHHLTAWYSGGRMTDMPMAEDIDRIWPDPDSYAVRSGIRVGDPIEMAAVQSFGSGDPPVWVRRGDRWAQSALDHPEGPSVLSIRGELIHPDVARLRSRDAQRRLLADLEEHDKTADLPKAEMEERVSLARQVEDYYRVNPEAPLTDVSIVAGRRLNPDEDATDTYMDALGRYDIEIKPLEHRQMWALEETLPTSSKLTSPHLQDLNLAAVAHSGLLGFSRLGDDTGLYIGMSLPNGTPVWLDPGRASAGAAGNQSPVVAIFGDPGSGKTFLLQSMAVQAALSGQRTILVNPKSNDDLSPISQMTGGETIVLGQEDAEMGALDPFRYAPPRMAARLAAINLLSLYRAEHGRRDLEAEVMARFDKAAIQSRCTMDLLQTLRTDFPSLWNFAQNLISSHPLVALTVAAEEREPFSLSGGLTLIQFDRPLSLPQETDPDKWEIDQAVSVSCLRMVLRACLEMLLQAGSGFLGTDEAWALLSWQEGLDFITRVGKEGRSQRITLALATHLIAEVAGRDLIGYLGRVFVGLLKDSKQAAAAFDLCGVAASSERMEWLRTECGPEAPRDGRPGKPATFFHRDLEGRHAPVMIAPFSESVRAAFSTSTADVDARKNQLVEVQP